MPVDGPLPFAPASLGAAVKGSWGCGLAGGSWGMALAVACRDLELACRQAEPAWGFLHMLGPRRIEEEEGRALG